MKVFRFVDEIVEVPRAHPWTHVRQDPDQGYRDFKRNPELIPQALEDFTPWSSYQAIQNFYQLLRDINGPCSQFESNDCAFVGPRTTTDRRSAKSLRCTGRLMILFRDLGLNLSKVCVSWLEEDVTYCLSRFGPDDESGVVGTAVIPVQYLDLPGTPFGYQLMLSFFAWGNTEKDVMANLDRVFRNLSHALPGPLRDPDLCL
jgi:hypothetical protein